MYPSISVKSSDRTIDRIEKIINYTDNIKRDESNLSELLSSEMPQPLEKSNFIRTISRGEIERVSAYDKSEDIHLEEVLFMTEDALCETNLQALRVNFKNQTQLINALHESASILKHVTDSDVVTVYIINPPCYIMKVLKDMDVEQMCDSWKVGPGTTIAAFTAHTKQFIITDNIYGDTRFPEGLGCEESSIQCAMTVPIITPNNEVKGVLEFSRSLDKDNYTLKNLDTVLAATTWIGNSTFYSEMFHLKTKKLSINQTLLKITNKYSTKFVSFEAALTEIMEFGKTIFGVQKSAFFLIISEENQEILADCYDSDEGKPVSIQRRSNMLINEDDKVVAKAAVTQKIVNINTTNSGSHCEVKYSMLCLPIVRNNKTLGVYQLINEKQGTYFSDEDEVMIDTFAIYFELILDLMVLKDKIDGTTHQLNVSNEILLYHIKPCKHEEDELLNTEENIPENFMTFLWYPVENNLNRLAELTLILFHETLGENFMKNNNMCKFILTIKNSYRPNPYHNFEHAFIVTHTMANILCRNRELFSAVEKEALMISTICHDLDHRGYTNNFIQMTNHPISTLYQGSPMENHHFVMAQKIMEQCDMCIYMKSETLNKLMDEIYEDIINTDLSIYFLTRLQLVEALKKRQFSWDIAKFRYLVKGILMTACDLSVQTKPYYLSKKSTYNIYTEFFNQGDKEKKMGLTPLPTMNRDNAHSLPENQVQFLSLIIMPCFHMIATLIPNTGDLFQGCRNLRSEWRELTNIDEKVSYDDLSSGDKYIRLLSIEKD